jgi:peroxiredoxin
MKSLLNTYTRIRFIVLGTFFSNLVAVSAQVTEASDKNSTNPLSGLTLAKEGDIAPGTPLMLNPSVTPIYDEELKLIPIAEFMNYMMSNEFIPEPYIDNDKSVKAFVLRKATDEEKAFMFKMQESHMNQGQDTSALLGTKANDFEVEDIKGKNYSLTELKGKIVVLNFWFIACKPCVMEMPELNELVEEFKEKDVVFIGLAINDKKQIKDFLKSNDFDYHIVPNSQAIINSYAITGFPTNMVIDKAGYIQYHSTGIGPKNKENLEQVINELLIE